MRRRACVVELVHVAHDHLRVFATRAHRTVRRYQRERRVPVRHQVVQLADILGHADAQLPPLLLALLSGNPSAAVGVAAVRRETTRCKHAAMLGDGRSRRGGREGGGQIEARVDGHVMVNPLAGTNLAVNHVMVGR
eukprot:7384778-Prymnesium_polylepis.2